MYCIGNCYCWALILKLIHGGQVFAINQELGVRGRNVKHYMLKDRNGRIRHFKRTFDFLPPPLCFLCFVGKIESSKRRKRRAKNN